MNTETAYALAALVCYGLGDFIYKRAASAGIAPDHFLMGQSWCFCPTVIGFAWLTGTLRFETSALWGCVAGLFILVGFMNYVAALRTGSVSVVAPVFRLNFIVTAALAIGWLGEPATVAKLTGFALALIAGWLLLGGTRSARTGDPGTARRALGQVLLATVTMGVANFGHKLGLIGGATPETMLVAQAVVYTGMMNGFGYARHGTMRLPPGVIGHSASAALVLTGAFLFMLHSLRHGDASVVVPISQMGFGVAAALGIVVFHEVVTARKIAGLGLAALALLVLAVG
jgi:uncharacterized membrane protein